ncbi:MAG: DNA-3-methyladenine glycosylase family protein [Pyrinomonadaceae bacterium]
MTNILSFETPKNFSFKSTVYSHGWSVLAPFELDEENWRLSFVFRLKSGQNPVPATIFEDSGKIIIETADKKLNFKDSEEILSETAHILRIEEDFRKFYQHTNKEKNLKWIAGKKAGRLLRSPSVFEDLVKTICTTNCSWALTKKMVSNLVEKLGESAENGKKTFPTAEAMAEMPVEFYRAEIRAGYRSPYFAELAQTVAMGKVNPEEWLTTELPTGELKKEMKKIKGVGDYAAENLLKLVGRYDGLALDSFLRSQFYKKHNSEIVCDDKIIAKHYEHFGAWRGLAIWLDMSERWLKF